MSDTEEESAQTGGAAAGARVEDGGDKKEEGKEGEVIGKRVRVKKWNAVAFWSYDIENDTCAICHNQLMVPCITCEAEPAQAEECSVAWGTCSHSYHFHCITRWLRTRSTCPLDDDEWEFVQY